MQGYHITPEPGILLHRTVAPRAMSPFKKAINSGTLAPSSFWNDFRPYFGGAKNQGSQQKRTQQKRAKKTSKEQWVSTRFFFCKWRLDATNNNVTYCLVALFGSYGSGIFFYRSMNVSCSKNKCILDITIPFPCKKVMEYSMSTSVKSVLPNLASRDPLDTTLMPKQHFRCRTPNTRGTTSPHRPESAGWANPKR